MGVRINGVWHEELADPETGGSDSGNGRNFSSNAEYNAVSTQMTAQNKWGENLNTWAGGTQSNQSALQSALGAAGAGGAGAQQVAAAIDKMLQAIADGNKQAFDETVREWNLVFGLDQDKFRDDVRRFNENLQIAQAGLTGTYQGQQTQQAQQQAFNQRQALAQMYGQDYASFGLVPQGMPTLAAQEQGFRQGYDVMSLASQLQANPFRQQQVLGQAGRLLGGQGVAGFSAPNIVQGVGTAGGNTQGGLGYLQQMINDIRDPSANTASMNSIINATPTPNKLNSVEFLRSAPSTQNLVLQAMQEKYGLDPKDALAQIQNTLPQFTAPSAVGTVRR